ELASTGRAPRSGDRLALQPAFPSSAPGSRLAPPRRPGPLIRLLRRFRRILTYVRLAACTMTAMPGRWVGAGALFAVVVINALIGFVQEGKAAALHWIRHRPRNGIEVPLAARPRNFIDSLEAEGNDVRSHRAASAA